MKITKILALGATVLFATKALAFQESQEIVVKFRGNYSSINAKQTGLPTPIPAAGTTAVAAGKLFACAYGGEVSATMFMMDHVAAEFGTGISIYKSKGTTLLNILNNFPNPNVSYTKKRDMYLVPSYVTLQYHIAPYGAIRPYVGAGYHYTYVIPRAKEFQLKNGSGVVFQGGLDVVLKNDARINFDAKYFAFKSQAKYSTIFASGLNGQQLVSKMNLNPFVVGIGVGFSL
jgi:outer membrane protein